MSEPSGRDVERNVSAAVRIAWLEDKLREAQALSAAKDEALRKAADLLEDAMSMASGEGYADGWVSDFEEATLACMKALSLTPTDALKRQEADERGRQRMMRDALCEAAGFIAVQPRANEPGSYVNELSGRMMSVLEEVYKL